MSYSGGAVDLIRKEIVSYWERGRLARHEREARSGCRYRPDEN